MPAAPVDLDKQHLAAEHNHFQYTHSPEAEEFLRIDDQAIDQAAHGAIAVGLIVLMMAMSIFSMSGQACHQDGLRL
jgi:hypothetical protein